MTEFVSGGLREPGAISATAAWNMGEALGRLHEALTTLPPGESKPLPSPHAIEKELRTLLSLARSREDNVRDQVAAGVIEAKLELLASIERMPEYTLQWTHGDYEWRNVLFDNNDEVAAIIDFDDAQYFSPARDVMRCIALSFPRLEPETDSFFAGYTSVRRLSPHDVRNYVEFYRYISTQRVWPIRARYLQPETYDPRWDDLIQPLIEWDWQTLSERLAEVAVTH